MSNKKEKLEYFKNILNKGLNDSLLNNRKQDYDELMELFKKHPEYPSKLKGVIDLKIITNIRNSKYYEFNLIKDNGSIEDISYRCCIYTRNSNLDFLNAMRNSIKPQIKEFRFMSKNKCEFCGDTSNIHIDHIYLFKYLVLDFKKLFDQKDIPITFDDGIDNIAIFKKEDKDFSDSWYEYHKTHATLRPLCKRCNLSRSKK